MQQSILYWNALEQCFSEFCELPTQLKVGKVEKQLYHCIAKEVSGTPLLSKTRVQII